MNSRLHAFLLLAVCLFTASLRTNGQSLPKPPPHPAHPGGPPPPHPKIKVPKIHFPKVKLPPHPAPPHGAPPPPPHAFLPSSHTLIFLPDDDTAYPPDNTRSPEVGK